MRVFAGTSGYSYKEWKGSFYPEKIKADEMLRHYAQALPAVEINNTFYRMPKGAVMERWSGEVPEGFRFVIKASRRITHMAKLQDPDELLGYLWGSIEKLGAHLGPVFFQLPKWLRRDVDLLRTFLAAVDGRFRTVFEFQHRTWLDDAVFAVLREHDATYLWSDDDSAKSEPELSDTADWGYVRLRRSAYTDADLERWAQRLRDTGWAEAWTFFKHEDDCAGPELALRFQAMFQD